MRLAILLEGGYAGRGGLGRASIPVHSFSTLMAGLATIVRNTCPTPNAGPDVPTFEILTTSNANQQRALTLIQLIRLLVGPPTSSSRQVLRAKANSLCGCRNLGLEAPRFMELALNSRQGSAGIGTKFRPRRLRCRAPHVLQTAPSA